MNCQLTSHSHGKDHSFPMFVECFAYRQERVFVGSTSSKHGRMICLKKIMRLVNNLHMARLSEIPAFSNTVKILYTRRMWSFTEFKKMTTLSRLMKHVIHSKEKDTKSIVI